MKRVVVFMLALCLAFGGVAVAEEAPLRVTVSFYPLYIAAINVARGVEGIEIESLTPPSAGCLHDYQMTTADRRVLEDSDVVVLNGAGVEGFLDKLLPSLSADVITVGDGIPLLPGHHESNGHIWVSVPGMIDEVRNLAAGLSRVDPENADIYAANAAAYIARLEALYADMRARLAPFEGAPIVTFHEAFDYFARDFGLRVVATVQSHHGSAPSAKDLATLAEVIREENVKALFAEPQYEDTSVDILARETGVPVYLLDPAVSGELDPTDYDAYLRVMRQNADTLAEALQ